MTIDAVNDILSGRVGEEIQNALGNTGASARVTIGAQSSLVVKGDVGGLTASAPRSNPATIVSFSPAANAVLSGAQVAFIVITANRNSDQTQASGNPSARQPAAPSPVSAATAQAPATAPAPLSLSYILDQAKADLADPTGDFYGVVNQGFNGPEQFASSFSDPIQRQSFIDAFNNQTLTIQNAANVAGLDDVNTTLLTGTSESLSGSSNEVWRTQQDAASGTYSTGLNIPLIGNIYVTWPKPA